MVVLVALGLSIVLLVGFLYLTALEKRHEVRYIATRRDALDAWVTHTQFVFTHVDFEAFMRESLRMLLAQIVHDVAHLTLLTVRAAERLLTRVVKHLRTQHELQ